MGVNTVIAISWVARLGASSLPLLIDVEGGGGGRTLPLFDTQCASYHHPVVASRLYRIKVSSNGIGSQHALKGEEEEADVVAEKRDSCH